MYVLRSINLQSGGNFDVFLMKEGKIVKMWHAMPMSKLSILIRLVRRKKGNVIRNPLNLDFSGITENEETYYIISGGEDFLGNLMVDVVRHLPISGPTKILSQVEAISLGHAKFLASKKGYLLAQ